MLRQKEALDRDETGMFFNVKTTTTTQQQQQQRIHWPALTGSLIPPHGKTVRPISGEIYLILVSWCPRRDGLEKQESADTKDTAHRR